MAEPYVTLFVDLAGSIDLYERLGDELAKGLVLDLQRLLTAQVEQFQGRMQEMIGDTINLASSNHRASSAGSNLNWIVIVSVPLVLLYSLFAECVGSPPDES